MQDYSLLTLYKASAGSGKTFQLAVRYISLLAENPVLYRNILAVTFTNKATQEMMQRILSQLYGISHGLRSSDSYLSEIIKFQKLKGKEMTPDAIRKNTGIALKLLLQDFSHFRIETIDSFFQSILRNMARELQLGGGLNIELDTKKVIAESIESFMGKLKRDTKDMDNVERFINGNMSNDVDWRINSRLESFASQLFQETFLENGNDLKKLLENPESIHEFRKKIDAFRDEKITPLETRISEIGATLLSMVPPGDPGKSPMGRGIETYFRSLQNLEPKEPGSTVLKAMSDPSQFFAKKYQTEYQSIGDQMQMLLQEAEQKKVDYVRLKNSYDLTTCYLYELSLILSIRREIDSLNNEKGRFLLADTTNLLTRMQDGDTSFIYERTGSFTDHMMIDEFQDTSRLQWHNLKIMMNECLARRKECLVVGDVKQSIYRWRNGDSNILNTEIDREFASFRPKECPLSVNRRSQKEIVDFNTFFFKKASETIETDYYSQFGEIYPELELAYGETGARQESVESKPGGYVKVAVNSSDQAMEETVAAEVIRLTEAGVSQSDITILFRTKNNMHKIIEYFNQNLPQFRLISAEAFRYGSSCAVRMIVNSLKCITYPDDNVALFQLAYDYYRHVMKKEASMGDIVELQPKDILPPELVSHTDTLKQLPLYELVERLYNILQIEQTEGQDAFIFSFLDELTSYLRTESADAAQFIAYWDETLCNRAIPSGSSEGIQLMTIHQSKGLEFHTVILPYCDANWPFATPAKGKTNNIWCKPDEEPFSEMPLIPVVYSKAMNDSTYHKAYQTEYGQTIMDNLNIFYVAFTRAAENLIILGRCAKDSGTLSAASLIKAIVDEDEKEWGTISPHLEKPEETRSDDEDMNPFDVKPLGKSVQMKSFGINANFRQSNDSSHFVHEATGNDALLRQDQFIDQGKLLHQLFSRIKTYKDVESELQQMLMDGQLESEKQATAILDIVNHAMKNPIVADWFSGNYTLFNETSILFRKDGRHKSLRPDRVMRNNEKTVILDYKFTSTERKIEEHRAQVKEYREKLKEMGIENVECYIWYFYSNKIEAC